MIVAHNIQQKQQRELEASNAEAIQLDREEDLYGVSKFDGVTGTIRNSNKN